MKRAANYAKTLTIFTLICSIFCFPAVFLLSGALLDDAIAGSTPRIHGGTSGNEGASFSPSVQAIAVTQNGTLYAGSFGMGVFRSEDDGQTWKPTNVGLTDHFLLCFAVDQEGRVYAGTVRGGVFRTKSNGQKWEQINKGLKRVEVKSLLVHSTGTFAGTGRGIFRWTESTKTWSPVSDKLDQLLIASMAMTEDHILLAATAGKGLFRYDVNETNVSKWQGKASDLVDPKERLHHRFLRIVATGKNDHIFLGTQDGGIFRSTDHGATWHTISRTLPNDSIRGIVWSNDGLFVGTGRGVYRLDENARRWKSVNDGLTDTAIQTLIVSGNGVMYAGTSAGAFRRDQHGNEWVNISKGLGQHTSRPGPYY